MVDEGMTSREYKHFGAVHPKVKPLDRDTLQQKLKSFAKEISIVDKNRNVFSIPPVYLLLNYSGVI